MLIQQLSVFLENKPGRLCAVLDVLAEHQVDISALSLADTAEFGVLRLIVDQPEKARALLLESGVVVRITQVNAVAMNDAPGGLAEILQVLSSNQLNIEYLYACVGKISGKAFMVLRTDDSERAEKILQEKGYAEINPAEIYRI